MIVTAAKPKPLPRIVAPTACTLIPGEWIGITIPMAPPAEVSPNYHGNRYRRDAATKAYRAAAKMSTVNVVNQTILRSWERPFPEGTRLALRIVVGWGKGHKRLDRIANLSGSIKAAEDGFADGIGSDDRYFTLSSIEQVRDMDGIGWTRIEAVPVEAT